MRKFAQKFEPLRKFTQKLEPFQLIFIILSIFFSFIIFLSIPSIFDYKKIQPKLEKKIESEYNFSLKDIKDIKYRFLPSPHLVLSDANLQLSDDKSTKIGSLSDIKIFISLLDIYNNKNISIKQIKIEKENFRISYKNIPLLIDHLYSKKTGKLIIEKSKIFLINKKNEVSLISPISKFTYKLNNKTNQKKLKIIGNAFDTNFDFLWSTKEGKDSFYNWNLKFKDPIIQFENEIDLSNEKKKIGSLKTNFLNNNINISYTYNNEIVEFNSNDNKFDKYILDGKIKKKPFYFNINASLRNQKINSIIKNVLLNYFNFKDNIHENLNGKLKLKFQDLQEKNFNEGFINFNFTNSKLFFEDNEFNINKIGTIKILKSFFYENKEKVFFVSHLEIDIKNQNEFYRRFSISKKERIKLDKIYCVVSKNIDNQNYSIFDISFNEITDFNFDIEDIIKSNKLYFDNFQKFRKIVKNEFRNINQD